MSKTIRIAYATTAEESLIAQIHHLAPYLGVKLAQTRLATLIDTLEKAS